MPNFEQLSRVMAQNGITSASREALVTDPRVMELIEQAIASMSGEFAQYEKIKKITLIPHEFSIDAGELTPTLKVKRKAVYAAFKDQFEALYEAAK